MTTETTDWEITTERYVGFIDIMGFKDMVARKSHEDIATMMYKIKKDLKQYMIDQTGKEGEFINHIATFSDSIIVFSKSDGPKSLNGFILAMAYIQRDLLLNGIPYKGACAYGKVTCDIKESIFFGQPLIDAFLLEENMFFYDVALHNSMSEKVNNALIHIFEYNAPLKNGYELLLTIEPKFVTNRKKKYLNN